MRKNCSSDSYHDTAERYNRSSMERRKRIKYIGKYSKNTVHRSRKHQKIRIESRAFWQHSTNK